MLYCFVIRVTVAKDATRRMSQGTPCFFTLKNVKKEIFNFLISKLFGLRSGEKRSLFYARLKREGEARYYIE